jgi:hypothetical protein
LPARIIGAVSVALALLLFFPGNFFEQLRISNFMEAYDDVVGIVFLILTAITAINLLKFAKDAVFLFVGIRQRKRELRKLSADEKRIIATLLNTSDNMQQFNYRSGSVRKLEYLKMIGRTATTTFPNLDGSIYFPYMLHPWVFDELNKDASLKIDILTHS